MENIKKFIGNIMVASGNNSASNNRSNNNPIASVADKSQQNSNDDGALNYARGPLRSRTESECSNASVSSISSIETSSHYGRPITQKDKDSYFWVMWHS